MINKLYSAVQKPRAIIFCEKKISALNECLKNYIKSIVCNTIPFCNQCEYCQKVDSGTYRDLIIFDGSKQAIKKDDIVFIQDQFNLAPFEKSGKKIYVLMNVDNSTTEAMNSLLKFIEEPPKETYAILTTKNISKVIPTIRSRCQVFQLHSNIKFFKKEIEKFNLDPQQKNVVIESYFNFDDFNQDFASGKFQIYYSFITNLIGKHNDLSIIKALSGDFKQFEYYEIKKILQFACVLLDKQKLELVKMINEINLFPAKILIFNKLWEVLDE